MIFADGFEKAFLGVGTQFNKKVAVYSSKEVILNLMADSDMTFDEAVEYFYYNIVGSYVGEETPVFLEEMSHKEAERRAERGEE
tara:strand:+ start:791 stop:1042 length:252 start_codon:yes stop_codon:yes gene_type:complete